MSSVSRYVSVTQRYVFNICLGVFLFGPLEEMSPEDISNSREDVRRVVVMDKLGGFQTDVNKGKM